MEFFGIGTWELMVIGLIALIVLGPKQMIILARRAGELLRQFQAIWQEASKTIDKEIKAIESEAGDLTQLPKELTALTDEMKNALTLNKPSNGRSQTPPSPASPSIRPPALAAPPSAWQSSPTQPAAASPQPSAPDTQNLELSPQHSEPPNNQTPEQPNHPAPAPRSDSGVGTTEPASPKYTAWKTNNN